MSKALDPKDTCVLVTGGAGFIGSHTVVQLLEGGYQVVIVDDLSNSSAVAVDRVKAIVGDEAAKNLTFYEANVLDRDAMNKIFDTHQIDRVIHFAGFKAVGESREQARRVLPQQPREHPGASSTSCAITAASPSSSRAPRHRLRRPGQPARHRGRSPWAPRTNPYGHD